MQAVGGFISSLNVCFPFLNSSFLYSLSLSLSYSPLSLLKRRQHWCCRHNDICGCKLGAGAPAPSHSYRSLHGYHFSSPPRPSSHLFAPSLCSLRTCLNHVYIFLSSSDSCAPFCSFYSSSPMPPDSFFLAFFLVSFSFFSPVCLIFFVSFTLFLARSLGIRAHVVCAQGLPRGSCTRHHSPPCWPWHCDCCVCAASSSSYSCGFPAVSWRSHRSCSWANG